MSTWKQVLGLLFFVALCFTAAWVGSTFTMTSVGGWYAQLVKPSWNPPSWLFGPVWSTLYLLMGISAWLVWRRKHSFRIGLPMTLFVVQLFLNLLWSIIFFGRTDISGALIDLVLLWIAIVATIIAFARVSRAAAWLLMPYLLWVSFAGVLNYTIWRLNP